MKSRRLISFISVLALTMSPQLLADTYMKSQVILAGESQSWTSGLKKRVESQIPIVGKVVIITRVDKGVEWILKPDKKMYQEKPIALPYSPAETSGSGSGNENNFDYETGQAQESVEKAADCVPEFRRLPEPRTIAGYKSTGFTMVCGSETLPGKIWMAPPIGPLAAVEKEASDYGYRHAVALYANFPQKDQQELIPATAKMGDLVKEFIAKKMGNGAQFPKGVMMAMEGALDGEGKVVPLKTIFEIQEIRTQTIDPKVFEIPADYQKVPDLTKAVIKSGLETFAPMIQAVKSFMAQAGNSGSASSGDPVQGMKDWIKKALQNNNSK